MKLRSLPLATPILQRREDDPDDPGPSRSCSRTGVDIGAGALPRRLAIRALATNRWAPVTDEISPEVVNKHTFLEPFDTVMVSKCVIIFFLVIYFCCIFIKMVVGD